ncbi:MAG TPA: sigma-54-dependent Fis family transcriptional regulator [Rhodocyclaceae bacterium]
MPADAALMRSNDLKDARDGSHGLIAHAGAVMEYLYEQIRQSGSLVLLSDANGLLLHSLGDPEFLDRADRVLLRPGATWDENVRGTNAVGTALVEERPVEVYGAEHFFETNSFLTCSAAPLIDPRGKLVGVLDISGDYRTYQRHTLGLVRMAAQIIERRLFESEHARDILVSFHQRPEFLGTLSDGLMAIGVDGRVLSANRTALEISGLRREELVGRDFSTVFATPLGALLERLRSDAFSIANFSTYDGRQFSARLRGDLPRPGVAVSGMSAVTVRGASRVVAPATGNLTLDSLATGDQRLQTAIDKARRILGRDIPILIQGESGAGKEMFAKAFHCSGPRAAGNFVALNCAAIPETLIESELFGYQGGAFTGARKEGAIGKIQQAHGGTLFLDEIGDMPLHMQARLLRVLQERSVTPLGGNKSVPVDISLVCATHRKLKEEVARGSFREDLYYRLNGLCITVPALRERTDLRQLVHKLIDAEAAGRAISVSEDAMDLIERYSWPGNIRQLNNVIRVAIALLDDSEQSIGPNHLPDELSEVAGSPAPTRMDAVQRSEAPPAPRPAEGASLEAIERQAILNMLDAVGGNISAAARKLGISRNTLYRKIGRL